MQDEIVFEQYGQRLKAFSVSCNSSVESQQISVLLLLEKLSFKYLF